MRAEVLYAPEKIGEIIAGDGAGSVGFREGNDEGFA